MPEEPRTNRRTTPASVADYARTWQDAYPPTGELHLRAADGSVRMASNSTALLNKLRRYFGEFVCPAAAPIIEIAALEAPSPELAHALTIWPPDPGKTKLKDEYIDLPDGRLLRKRQTGMVFAYGHGGGTAIGPAFNNDNQVVNFVNNRLIQRALDRGALLCHAAGVAHAGRGLLLAGLSGRGKSTLALHLLEQGCRFISNDRLLLFGAKEAVAHGHACSTSDVPLRSEQCGTQPIIAGVPKLPRVNPGTLLSSPRLRSILSPQRISKLTRLSSAALWQLEEKYDVDVWQAYGAGRFVTHAPLAGIVVLAWQRDAGPLVSRRINLAEHPDLLAAVMKSPGVHYVPPAPPPDLSPEAYLRALSATPALALTGGADFDGAIRACMDLLAAGSR